MQSKVPVKVFLDLEETIIVNFNDPLITLCNVGKIRDFLQDLEVKEVTIFSFAIWDAKDLETFNSEIKPMIERGLNVKVVACPTTEEIRKTVLKRLLAHFNMHDFLSLWGKKRAFIEFVQEVEGEGEFILIDDCVPMMSFKDHTTKQKVHLINVTHKWDKLHLQRASIS